MSLRPEAYEGGTDAALRPSSVSIEVGSQSARESEQRPSALSIDLTIPDPPHLDLKRASYRADLTLSE